MKELEGIKELKFLNSFIPNSKNQNESIDFQYLMRFIAPATAVFHLEKSDTMGERIGRSGGG
jgi:hypothetical protein